MLGHLVLGRRPQEAISIVVEVDGQEAIEIEVKVIEVHGKQVKLMIVAPQESVRILRDDAR